jgi:PAS domain S-box-containing protein
LAEDFSELHERLWRYGLIITLVLTISSLAGLALSLRLQRIISGPMADLSRVVARVTSQKDYSVRALKSGKDEMGQLIEGFNGMLDQIQSHENQLQAAHDNLEKRVEQRTAELARSFSLLNATLDSTADGILAIQLDRTVVCCNRQFAQMWCIPNAVLARLDDTEMLEILLSQVVDRDQFLRCIKQTQTQPEQETFDVLQLLDGRVFERYVRPQRLDGRVVGSVVNFRDVTERRNSEVKLEEAHRQLVDASRQAGMAEVATGVLHNVGNVLNSVNVSATLVAEALRDSKIGNLEKLAALLNEKSSNLAEFFASDPRAQKLPTFVSQLAQHLRAEQENTRSEIEQLRKNIEHIKEIVSMQQSYARVSGLTENLDVTTLVEDSLRLNKGALLRHGVKLVRDFDPVPPIPVEKHKVLQILVNLIRNAKYACDESGRSDKRITVRVQCDDETVKISVADNGIGIPPENLTRIFAHGFTTRQEGHGFGLHSGALAARELCGALTVESAGAGCGAEFTLELPITSRAAKQPEISAVAA